MVVITISGVGFGEVRPMSHTAERIHTMLVIALGMVAVALHARRLRPVPDRGRNPAAPGAPAHASPDRDPQRAHGRRRVRPGRLAGLRGAGRGRASRSSSSSVARADRRDRALRVPLRPRRRDRGDRPPRSRTHPRQGPRHGHAQRRRERLHHPDRPPDVPRRHDRRPCRAAEHAEEAPPGRGQSRRPARRDRRPPDRLAADQPDGRRVHRAGHAAVEPGDRDGRRADPHRQPARRPRPSATPTSADGRA